FYVDALRSALYSSLFPYTTLFRSLLVFAGVSIVCLLHLIAGIKELIEGFHARMNSEDDFVETISVDEIPENCARTVQLHGERVADRKSTRLNSSHVKISYAVFCLK